MLTSPPGCKKEKYENKKSEKEVKKEGGGGGAVPPSTPKLEGGKDYHSQGTPHRKSLESDQIRDLKAQLK